MFYVGLCLAIIGWDLIPLRLFLATSSIPILVIAVLTFIIGGMGLKIIGYIYCQDDTPNDFAVKAINIATMALMFILLEPIALLVFMIYLRRLARFLGQATLAERAHTLITAMICLGVTAGLLGGMVGSGIALNREMIQWVSCLLALAGLMVFIRYANLVNALAKAMRMPEGGPVGITK